MRIAGRRRSGAREWQCAARLDTNGVGQTSTAGRAPFRWGCGMSCHHAGVSRVTRNPIDVLKGAIYCTSPLSGRGSTARRLTDHPPAAWAALQLREVSPGRRHPRNLLRDRDPAKYAEADRTDFGRAHAIPGVTSNGMLSGRNRTARFPKNNFSKE